MPPGLQGAEMDSPAQLWGASVPMEGRKLLVPGENRAPQWGLPQPVPHGKFPGLVLSPELIPMICCHCLVPKPRPYRQT